MATLNHLRIPIWREGLVALERAALTGDPVWRGDGVRRGYGEPVLLIPGFMAGDASLGMMASWLRRIGYRPCRAGISANVDCTARAVRRLEEQLERHVERHGRPATIVGQSRGGTMARILAVRRPDLVDAIACLGSPLVDQFAVHPLVRLQVHAVALLGSIGVQGLFSHGCRETCCVQTDRELSGPFPNGVRFTSVYSRSDGIVDWRSCLDPAARQVEVRSTHVGMAVNPAVFRVVADLLAAAESDKRSDPETEFAAARAA